MLEIDGGMKSGSGTILRLSIALASILQEELHLYNIRKRRQPPGLRPQHLEAVLTAAKICNGEVKGTTLGSREIWFNPRVIHGGKITAQIGTAGSIPMVLMTILPICAFARQRTVLHIGRGGTDVRYSPTINYIRYVLLPMLERMQLQTSLTIHKYGYYPKGMGEVSVIVQPCPKLQPIHLTEFGKQVNISGVSVCTFLEDRRVAERQATAAKKRLRLKGHEVEIEVIYDKSNPLQKGSSLVLWAQTERGALLGGDAIGKLRKSSEIVGQEAANNLLKELRTQATVDIHLADMLIPYIGLAQNDSIYLTRSITEHIDTNIWLTQKILGVDFKVRKMGKLYRIMS